MKPHGTLTRYSKHGCRCPLCRRANTIWQLANRKNKRKNGLCRECVLPHLPGKTRCYYHLYLDSLRCKKHYPKRKKWWKHE